MTHMFYRVFNLLLLFIWILLWTVAFKFQHTLIFIPILIIIILIDLIKGRTLK
jgi:hypothetical protein